MTETRRLWYKAGIKKRMYTIVLSLLLLFAIPLLFPDEFITWSQHLRQRLEERAEQRKREAAQLAHDADQLRHDIQSRMERHHQELAAIRKLLTELEHQTS